MKRMLRACDLKGEQQSTLLPVYSTLRIFILRTLRYRRARNQSFGAAADFQAVAVATRQIPRFPSEVPSHPS